MPEETADLPVDEGTEEAEEASGGTAVLSDIHSNPHAYEAVLEDMEKFDIRRVLFLGDLVGYGGGPRECLRLMQQMMAKYPTDCIIGNHDEGTQEEAELSNFKKRAKQAILWTRKQLVGMSAEFVTEAETFFDSNDPAMTFREYMEGLKYIKKGVFKDRHFLAVHGTPSFPEGFDYITNSKRAAYAIWEMEDQSIKDGVPYTVCLAGHSHRRAVWCGTADEAEPVLGDELELEDGRKYVINAGSVGQPRDHDPRACWVYVNDRVLFRRVPYDVRGAMNLILATDMPKDAAHSFANRLKLGK